jgi:aspartate-semialdehyde dehydrogenase
MKVAVLGATGAVGRTMLRVLAERSFPVDALVPLASPNSAGTSLEWCGRQWSVRAPAAGAFDGCAIALFSAGAARSREWGPAAAAAGAVVVDNSSAWRMDPDVPLIVPEVNADAAAHRPRGIIANPNCATIQMVLPLAGLHWAGGLRRVIATTFQSVSGAGNKGVEALHAEQGGQSDAKADGSPFTTRIAGNVIPFIGPRLETGWNEEEEKIRAESRKILGLPALELAATCVRVPVDVGHSVAITAELERPLSVADAAAAIRAVAGVDVYGPDHDPTPHDVAGRDAVAVGRLRRDADRENVLHFWVVGDNLRKGAATNAVQIAEQLIHG